MNNSKEKRERRHSVTNKIIAFSILYIVIIVANFSGETFSRYLSRGIGNSSISVAKWDVSIDTTNQSSTLNIIAGNTIQNYVVKVSSHSEVATTYSIDITNLPNGMQVSVDGGQYQTADNGSITFSNIGTFNINDANNEHTHTLTFNMPLNASVPGSRAININVRFLQKIS